MEQIISAHSEVKGAGELKFISQLGGAIGLGKKAASKEKFLQVREFYLEKLNKLSNGKKKIHMIQSEIPCNRF